MITGYRPTMSPLVLAFVVVLLVCPLRWPGEAHASERNPLDASSIVVKVQVENGYTIDQITALYPVALGNALLATRGIYLVQPTDHRVAADPHKVDELARMISRSSGVSYAEPNFETHLSDTRYHGWPEGDPEDGGNDASAWRGQPISDSFELPRAHQLSTGVGSVVAVLDSGVDISHPALAGRLLQGYDYVADDPDPTEEPRRIDTNRNGIVSEAYGHGTFVAGMVNLIAPDALILPQRVLDTDGTGSVFVVAQAIIDAVDEGADVINLSMGTGQKFKSQLIEEAIKYAVQHEVVVIAAAGNAATDARQYPAQNKDVLSVTSADADRQLSPFACWGDWVDLAAPAGRVMGPVPGGRFAWWAGTSMAAPQVAGQAALIRSRAGGLKTKDQIESITKSAHKLRTKKLKYGQTDIVGSIELADVRIH